MDSKGLRQISEKEWYYGNLSGDENGIGLKRERDGSLYYGGWKDGLRNGKGSLAKADGGLIVGEWANDQLVEITLRVWPEENIYAAFWGKMEDKTPKEGTLLRADGRLYHGVFTEWRGEEFDGEGALLWQDKRIYAGRWKNGGTDIGGVIRRADGRMTGTLSNVRAGYRAKSWQKDAEKQFFYGMASDEEARNAQGILFYSNGEFFAGKMRGGQRSGFGAYRGPDESVRIGEWKNGAQQGYGIWFRRDMGAMDFYIGGFLDDRFDGGGCLLHRNDNGWDFCYSGSWKKGKESGKGISNLGGGQFFVGGFREGMRDGRGETVLPDGMRNAMNWKMGIPVVSLDEVRKPGPPRKLFKTADEITAATFNSLEKNGEFGEEQCFVGIREGADSPYRRFWQIEPNRDYEVRIFYHNNAGNGCPGGAARETKLRAFYPKKMKPGEEGVVSASISAKETSPPVVWDCVRLSASEELSIRYKIASAKIWNERKSNGRILPQALFTEHGVFLGADELDGILPPGEMGEVTFLLHVQRNGDGKAVRRGIE